VITDELPWVDVESSNIHRVAYETDKLYIQFQDDEGGPGAIYEYADVPRDRYQRLLEANSTGSMFGKLIKGKFAYARVDVENPDEVEEIEKLKTRVEVLERDMENLKKGVKALLAPRMPK
jgi:hypothetical protein